jgi:hypothetical protein
MTMYIRPRPIMQGDPGIFGSIGKALGGVARVAGGLLPGPLGAVAGAVGGALAGRSSAPALGLTGGFSPGGPGRAQRPVSGFRGFAERVLPGGRSGYTAARRRMNAGNAKAARRAIRRIKAVRHLLMSIEREMPHRKCTRPHAKRR